MVRLHEVGGGQLTWLPERVNAQGMAVKQKQERDAQGREETNSPEDNSERVKKGTIILRLTSTFFPWQLQLCSLSYDFKELSMCTNESGSIQATSTIDLADAELVDVKDPPKILDVHDTGKDDTAPSQVNIVAMFQIFIPNGTQGKKLIHSFAFQFTKEYEEWRAAFQECGCVCDGQHVHSTSSSLPPKPPFPTTNGYDMNDIDEDSFHSHQQNDVSGYEMNDIDEDSVPPEQQQRQTGDYEMNDIDEDSVHSHQQRQPFSYEMNDIDEDSVPPDHQQEQWHSTGSRTSTGHEHDDDKLFSFSDDEDNSTRSKGEVNDEKYPLPSSTSTPSKQVHPHVHLFEQINRNGSETINMTGFMIGLRRHEEVAKALKLPSNSRQEDGTRDRCVAVFNAMDDDQSGYINERKFLKYMDMLDAKEQRQQQFIEDPAAYYINSEHHDERKEDSSVNANSNLSPKSTQNSSPGSADSKTRSHSRSSFYGKIARKIQSETNHKRKVSVAIRPENISKLNASIDQPTDNKPLFMNTETNGDFLEDFRTKNGMNGAAPRSQVPFEEERKSTDNAQQRSPVSSLFGSEYDDQSHADSDIHPSALPTSSSLAESLLSDLKFIVLEAVHPARGVRSRLRLRELFRNDPSNTIDYTVAQKFFFENNEALSPDSPPPDLFPYLTKGACSWHDCNRYLRHYEEKIKPANSDFRIKIEISLPVSGYSCVLTTPVLNWVQKAGRKIKTLPLPDMHRLSLQQVMEFIQMQHCVDIADQLSTLCLIEMTGAENYVQFLEETTQCFAKPPRKKASANGSTEREPQDDIDRSFAAADTDNDGSISRQEWRRMMSDREGLVRSANEDKQKLIEENNRLRKALGMGDSTPYSLQLKEKRAENYERYLDVKNEEIAELKMELNACKKIMLRHEQERDNERHTIAAPNQRPPSPPPLPQENSTLFDLEEQQPMYELLDDNVQEQVEYPPSPPSSPPLSVAMSLSNSLPPLSIPDHYSEHMRRQQYVDRLLNSRVYGPEETAGWARKESPRKIVVGEEDKLVPPSLNEIARRQHSPDREQPPQPFVHTPQTPDKSSHHHPLRRAFIHNTKALDLSPLALTSRAIGTHTHTPKNKTPHKSFKDHTSSSRSKVLPEKGTGLFSGVRSPGVWSNSQVHVMD